MIDGKIIRQKLPLLREEQEAEMKNKEENLCVIPSPFSPS